MSLFLNTLAGKQGSRAPFWYMRQAGRYLPEYRELRANHKGFLDLCFTPESAAEVTLQPIRRFDMDAAILFSDILVVPYALGVDVRFVEGEGPKLPPIESARQVGQLSFAEEKIAPVLSTVSLVSAALAKDKALIGFAGSPWTVACYMVEGGGSRDFASTRHMAIKDPALFQQLIDTISDATLIYLSKQIESGAQAIQLFDSWAGVLPERDFTRWVVMPTTRIVRALKEKHPSIPIIGFPRLAGAMGEVYARETGVDAISIDYSLPLAFAAEKLQPHVVVQGNLDPLLVVNDKNAMLAEAKRIYQQLGSKPFVFNLGHGMVPQTPIDHVKALSDYLLNP